MEVLDGLRGLFGALSVGLLVILCFAYLYWILVESKSDNFIQWVKTNSLIPRDNYLGILIITILIITIGHIAQDLTDNLADSDNPLNNFYPFLKTESEHRFNTLVKQTDEGYKLTGLGKEVFSHRNLIQSKIRDHNGFAFTENPDGYLKQINVKRKLQCDPLIKLLRQRFAKKENKDQICSPTQPEEQLKSAQDVINQIYYQSKNWAYNQQNYYNLLSGIHSRIDFNRSLYTISGCFATVFAVLLLINLLIDRLIKSGIWSKITTILDHYLPNNRYILIVLLKKLVKLVKDFSKQLSKKQANILISIVILSIISLFTLQAYNHAETMFNERVFGKYVSHFDHANLDQSKLAKETPNQPVQIENNAVWWVHQSLEYKISTQQVYNMAINQLEDALTNTQDTAIINVEYDSDKKPAIIMDLDETVLDNSLYQKQLIESNSFYTPYSWDQWIQKQEAQLISGAKDFIKEANKKKIKVFYITNRRCNGSIRGSIKINLCPQEQDTITNLQKHGITATHGQILLRDEQPSWNHKDKSERRKSLAKRYNIIMLVGDDLQDFIPSVLIKEAKEGEDKKVGDNSQKVISYDKFLKEYNKYLGKKWFLLPNPIYGSWQQRL